MTRHIFLSLPYRVRPKIFQKSPSPPLFSVPQHRICTVRYCSRRNSTGRSLPRRDSITSNCFPLRAASTAQVLVQNSTVFPLFLLFFTFSSFYKQCRRSFAGAPIAEPSTPGPPASSYVAGAPCPYSVRTEVTVHSVRIYCSPSENRPGRRRPPFSGRSAQSVRKFYSQILFTGLLFTEYCSRPYCRRREFRRRFHCAPVIDRHSPSP